MNSAPVLPSQPMSEMLRQHVTEDHARGCMGRQYSCDCGYDIKTEGALEMAANRIEALDLALRTLADAVFEGGLTRSNTDAWLAARAALEAKS